MSQAYPFSGHIQGDNIYGYESDDFTRSNPIHIGVINKVHGAVKAELDRVGTLAESYYARLVELDDETVRPEPAPEDVIREQALALADLRETVNSLAGELKTMKEAGHESGGSGGGRAAERGEGLHQTEAATPSGSGNRGRHK